MLNGAQGVGALSLALGLMFVGCGSDDDGSGDDDGGEAGSAGSSSGRGGSSGKGGTSGKGGKGGSAGSAGSGAATGGTSGRGGGGGTAGSAGEAGASAGQGGANGGDGGDPSVGGAQAGESSGGEASGGEGNAGGEASGGETNGAGGAGGDGVTGGNAGVNEAGAGGGASALSPITVFDGGTANSGATWSGRTGLDNLCLAAKNAQSIAGGTPHALISVSAADDIADFPTLYGLPTDRAFASTGGAVIADDFADLLDGTIDLSIEVAGILLAEPGLWFTGSNADGTASANTCEGWTTTEHSTVSPRANYGYTGNTNSWWLDGSSTATCAAAQYHVLCVTWE